MNVFNMTGLNRSQGRWSHLVAYRCPSCGDNCINELDTAAARYRRCRTCLSVPELDDLDDDPDGRQADDLVCGAAPASERPEDGQKPGTAEGRARNVPRSEGSEVPSTAVGDAAERLAYRRGGSE